MTDHFENSGKIRDWIDFIVVGLGNPGPDYAGTRHNLGFRALDEFVKSLGVPKDFVRAGKSKTQPVRVDNRIVLLVKPSTFMNLSGTAVAPLLQKFNLDISRVLVIHDEMDIPPGKIKMRVGGSPAGHNGVSSIIDLCGNGFTRLKIGIGSPSDRRENNEPLLSDGALYVLDKLTPEEDDLFSKIMPMVAEGIRRWILDGREKTMTWLNAPPCSETDPKSADSAGTAPDISDEKK